MACDSHRDSATGQASAYRSLASAEESSQKVKSLPLAVPDRYSVPFKLSRCKHSLKSAVQNLQARYKSMLLELTSTCRAGEILKALEPRDQVNFVLFDTNANESLQ